MINSFSNAGTEDIFNGVNSSLARRTLPSKLWIIAGSKLDQLDSVDNLDELQIPPGNHLEYLSGNRKGQYSIRINNKYRICFRWSDEGPHEVEIVDYH
jgi:toxin HigB-1